MYKHLTGLLLVFICGIAYSQSYSFDDYTPLQCEGKIPADFRFTFSEKYAHDVSEKITGDEKRAVRKSKQAFLMESNFYLNELLTSGKVLYGDPVTEYVNRVADEVFAPFPELRSELRFYVTKSPYVNAFSTDKGIIFVNLGLIAQLENEAQLAYILAHEAVHYAKKHSMELYLFRDKTESRNRTLSREDYEDRLLSVSYRSKESEMTADEEGLKTYYVKSRYSYRAVRDVFDVLLYSYLPFDVEPFSKSFFEQSFFKFPEDYKLDSVAEIDPSEYLESESQTHPSIEKRVEKAYTLLEGLDDTGRSDFILPREDFIYVRTLARFESVRLKLHIREYTEALYDSYMLLKEYPDSRFLNKAIATSLYMLSHYKSSGVSSEQTGYRKIQGEPQQAYYFLQKLDRTELNVLALGWCWRCRTKYPDSRFLQLATDALAEDLIMENDTRLGFFSSKPPDTSKTAVGAEVQDTARTSKYGKIKQKKQKSEGTNYLKYAFVDMMNDTAFTGFYSRAEARAEELTMARERGEGKSKRFRKCKNQCIDHIVIADPYYLQFDSRREGSVKFFKTEAQNRKVIDIIREAAAQCEVTADLLIPADFSETDSVKINDYARMQEWLAERFVHDEGISPIPVETDNIQTVMDKYGTHYLSWTGLICMRLNGGFSATDLILLLSIYGIPIAIYRLATPDWSSLYYHVLYDTDNGSEKLVQSVKLKERFSGDILRSRIFDSYFQIKHSCK